MVGGADGTVGLAEVLWLAAAAAADFGAHAEAMLLDFFDFFHILYPTAKP